MDSTVDLLSGVNLYLVGMMGAGKTTAGKILAKKLGYRFFDTDEAIERVAQQTIDRIFADRGEDFFRELETQVLSEVCAYTRMAIATGGGIVLKPKNWSYLHHGIVVWLDVPADCLYRRLQEDTARPLLQTENPEATLQQILQKRRSLYSQADLHVAIEASDSPEGVAERVLAALPKVLKPLSERIPDLQA